MDGAENQRVEDGRDKRPFDPLNALHDYILSAEPRVVTSIASDGDVIELVRGFGVNIGTVTQWRQAICERARQCTRIVCDAEGCEFVLCSGS